MLLNFPGNSIPIIERLINATRDFKRLRVFPNVKDRVPLGTSPLQRKHEKPFKVTCDVYRAFCMFF